MVRPGVSGPFSEEQLDEGLAKRCREVSVEDWIDTGIRVRKYVRTNLEGDIRDRKRIKTKGLAEEDSLQWQPGASKCGNHNSDQFDHPLFVSH